MGATFAASILGGTVHKKGKPNSRKCMCLLEKYTNYMRRDRGEQEEEEEEGVRAESMKVYMEKVVEEEEEQKEERKKRRKRRRKKKSRKKSRTRRRKKRRRKKRRRRRRKRRRQVLVPFFLPSLCNAPLDPSPGDWPTSPSARLSPPLLLLLPLPLSLMLYMLESTLFSIFCF